jgi:hypothetical protein
MSISKISLASLLAVSVAITSGCATQGGTTSSSSSGNECNSAGAALIGGLWGAAVGVATGGGGKGAAIGAGVGAAVAGLGCIAINANSKQTASADQARQQYQAQYKKAPDTVTVLNYTSSGALAVQKGSTEQINTLATIVTPQNGVQPVITEKLELTAPNNQAGPSVTKTLAQSGGGFAQTYAIPIPKEAPGGIWTYKTTIFIDGKPQKTSTGSFTVA